MSYDKHITGAVVTPENECRDLMAGNSKSNDAIRKKKFANLPATRIDHCPVAALIT